MRALSKEPKAQAPELNSAQLGGLIRVLQELRTFRSKMEELAELDEFMEDHGRMLGMKYPKLYHRLCKLHSKLNHESEVETPIIITSDQHAILSQACNHDFLDSLWVEVVSPE